MKAEIKKLQEQINKNIDNYLILASDVERLGLKIGQLVAEKQKLQALEDTSMLEARDIEVRTE